MVAEYQPDKVNPQKGRYYYCTTDQIGSTRIVTDDLGNVVYGAAHDPCAGIKQTKEDIQQNLDDSLNSELKINVLNSDIELSVNGNLSSIKFSGKEQDTESGLYYFGARYYDPTLYRFLSPDPVIPTDKALYNAQRWNLYGYCLGNPVNLGDINGFEPINILVQRLQ
ncbi:MAG: RHS repeat-associated core domain-containing protein [Candidatus Saccharicenans sp.]